MNPATNASRAGGQSDSFEYGVEFVSEQSAFVAAGYSESGARSMLNHAGDGSKWSPRAVRVMRRQVGEWVEAPDSAAGDDT